ncbi:Suppressor of fused protein (SUFU) [Sinosporangium album]|uniref:Suppressor of fused protein (SUFU) n=1 Tax=Sinosporangium album TaxID=504805 RepID=A0A1G7VF62_9ACTN|nr:suppressor of fused domain protein [Sinosporangium album]SDG58455.1 Suppressor of fused protein (SUFU) [Sinosporangium album]
MATFRSASPSEPSNPSEPPAHEPRREGFHDPDHAPDHARATRGKGRNADGTEVVLTDDNPYRSRTLIVERDAVSSVAYLCARDGTVHGASWLANHGDAPETVDLTRVNAGLPPVMPRPNTRHPHGRPPLGRLSALWFEEGDGVALYEGTEVLAVIPGWADVGRGKPGYARDALGETPFAWSLADAYEELGPRLAKAHSYWQWRRAEASWATFQQFVMSHLDGTVGTAGRFWDAGGDRMPTVGITERPPEGHRSFTILSTVGMSCQRMPTVERYIDRPDAFARVELAVATRGDPREAARLFLWLGQYPWHSVTWLGHCHTAKWYHDPATFPLGAGYHGVILVADPPGLPSMSGFTFGGDAVRWLWLVPLTESELGACAGDGAQAVLHGLPHHRYVA